MWFKSLNKCMWNSQHNVGHDSGVLEVTLRWSGPPNKVSLKLLEYSSSMTHFTFTACTYYQTLNYYLHCNPWINHLKQMEQTSRITDSTYNWNTDMWLARKLVWLCKTSNKAGVEIPPPSCYLAIVNLPTQFCLKLQEHLDLGKPCSWHALVLMQ